ncbi:MAG: hypothetical protein HYV67_02725 [Candidatus Taylorbacteria bacterium]|nr:hypothetical protein [Candidatus Taylorbacteria bacterium]
MNDSAKQKPLTKRKKFGVLQRKALTLLLAGMAFGLCRSPRKQWRIIRDIPKELERCNLQMFEYGLHRLVADRYIKMKDCGNNRYEACLTREGYELAESFSLDTLRIKKPDRWDKKWRIVFFDIPERCRRKRDVFRFHLRRLGFREIQRSVFAHPYPCGKEIIKIAAHYKLLTNVHYAVTDELSDSHRLHSLFQLT